MRTRGLRVAYRGMLTLRGSELCDRCQPCVEASFAICKLGSKPKSVYGAISEGLIFLTFTLVFTFTCSGLKYCKSTTGTLSMIPR